jgi:hypothetical protein
MISPSFPLVYPFIYNLAQITMPTPLFSLLLVSLLLPLALGLANVITFSKALLIPGQHYSVMNYTYDVAALDDYFDIGLEYQLTQVPPHSY